MTKMIKGIVKAVISFATVAGIVYAWAVIGADIMM